MGICIDSFLRVPVNDWKKLAYNVHSLQKVWTPKTPSPPLATSLYLFFFVLLIFYIFWQYHPNEIWKNKNKLMKKVISSCLQDYKISFFIGNMRLTLIWNSEMITRHRLFELTPPHPDPHPKKSTSLAPSPFYLKPPLNKGVELILWCFRRQI